MNAREISQWVINNRYKNMVSSDRMVDAEMYNLLIDKIEEYAQQQAVESAEWLSKRYAMTLQGNWMDMENPQGRRYTTAELYEIFKTESK